MSYDKTIFKPEEISTVGRYSFSVAGAAGESASEEAGSEDSSSADGGSSTATETDAPSQFDLGDFSDMKPTDEGTAAGGQPDEAPMLGGPEVDQ